MASNKQLGTKECSSYDRIDSQISRNSKVVERPSTLNPNSDAKTYPKLIRIQIH